MAGKSMQMRKGNEWRELAAIAEADRPELEMPAPHDLVAERAYFKAEQRGFEPGHELEDWLQAETELGQEGAKSSPQSV